MDCGSWDPSLRASLNTVFGSLTYPLSTTYTQKRGSITRNFKKTLYFLATATKTLPIKFQILGIFSVNEKQNCGIYLM